MLLVPIMVCECFINPFLFFKWGKGRRLEYNRIPTECCYYLLRPHRPMYTDQIDGWGMSGGTYGGSYGTNYAIADSFRPTRPSYQPSYQPSFQPPFQPSLPLPIAQSKPYQTGKSII